MSKTLAILRHAFCDKSQPNPPLLPQGRAQADSVAEQLFDAAVRPDVILHAPAARATETAERISEAFSRHGIRVAPVPQQWLAEDMDVGTEKKIVLIDPAASTAILVTHQPNVTRAVMMLTRSALHARRPDFAEAFVLESDAQDWAGVQKARMLHTLKP
jgi:phosphohistidine phosphatase SixA